MAFREFHAGLSQCPYLLFVKVATGIGAGMVIDGRLLSLNPPMGTGVVRVVTVRMPLALEESGFSGPYSG